MGKIAAGLLFGCALALTIVVIDLLLFRNHFGARLTANIGLALLFAAFYWRFFKLR